MDAALVTGCSAGGLGEGIARAFAKEGVHVFATSRSLTSLAHLESTPNITPLALDVTSSSSIAAALTTIKSTLKTQNLRLKYLINNAGLGLVSPVLNGTGITESEHAVFETNVWGPLALIRTFIPLMIDSGTGRGGGTVVNITSGGALVPLIWNGVYAASKAAMLILSETLRLEIEPLGVKTITVVLGIVKTNFHANLAAKEDDKSDGTGKEAARFVLQEGSYYRDMRGVLEGEASGKVQDESVMTAEEAGRRIVRDAIGDVKGRTFVGTKAGVLKWVGFFPVWLVDSIVSKTGKLDKFVEAG
ncbi:hypothetical protein VTL71DRAFT_3194 [Oculimacula yallundae]|uniref:NAD(P)-binding protein n=1 Tax=Oculimacula yallundae TaxID=86028 RepID=A0ABR4C8C9_9HELO